MSVGFVDYDNGDYRLSPSSLYKNAGTDGKDLGADIGGVNAATACVVSGACGGDRVAPAAPTGLGVR